MQVNVCVVDDGQELSGRYTNVHGMRGLGQVQIDRGGWKR